MTTKNKNDKFDEAPNQVKENALKGSKVPAKKVETLESKVTCTKSREKHAAKVSTQDTESNSKSSLASKINKTRPKKPAITYQAQTTPAQKRKSMDTATEFESKGVLSDKEMMDIKKFKESLALLRADVLWESFIKEQESMLLTMESILLPNMQSATRDNLRLGNSNDSSSSGQHIGDAGSDTEVRNLSICLLGKDREQLMEIESALQRIRKGVYGICEISLEPIPKGRLRVRPFCRLTVKCQEEYEKKFGSTRVFCTGNSNIIGYAGIENKGESAIQLDENL